MGLDGLSENLSQAVGGRGVLTSTIKSVVLENGVEISNRVKPNELAGLVVVAWRAVQEELASGLEPERIHCSHSFKNFEVQEVRIEHPSKV